MFTEKCILPKTWWFQQAGRATVVLSTTEFHFKAIKWELSFLLCWSLHLHTITFTNSVLGFLSTFSVPIYHTGNIWKRGKGETQLTQYNVSFFVTPPEASIAMDLLSTTSIVDPIFLVRLAYEMHVSMLKNSLLSFMYTWINLISCSFRIWLNTYTLFHQLEEESFD